MVLLGLAGGTSPRVTTSIAYGRSHTSGHINLPSARSKTFGRSAWHQTALGRHVLCVQVYVSAKTGLKTQELFKAIDAAAE